MRILHVLRKPLNRNAPTIASNVFLHGTGGFHIDACRIPTLDSLSGGDVKASTVCSSNHEAWDRPWKHDEAARAAHAEKIRANVARAEELGRWPPNLVLQHSCREGCVPPCPVAVLDQQSGVLKSGTLKPDSYTQAGRDNGSIFAGSGQFIHAGYAADSGGASRFFKQVRA